jgi:hypothetical protein
VPTPSAEKTTNTRLQSSRDDLSSTNPTVRRYQDGYRVGNLAVLIGFILKGVAWVVGITILCTGIYIAEKTDNGLSLFLSLVLAVVAWVVFFFFGVLIAAVGQLLYAQIDTAVHTSPLMSDKERQETIRSWKTKRH